MRSKIFRQVVQINQGKADALPRFFGQADGIIFKQAVRLELGGVAFIITLYINTFAMLNQANSPNCNSILPLCAKAIHFSGLHTEYKRDFSDKLTQSRSNITKNQHSVYA